MANLLECSPSSSDHGAEEARQGHFDAGYASKHTILLMVS